MFSLAREFIHYIADVIREKMAGIVRNTNFMAVLSDGSQARKTKDEKELVLVRIERSGVPTYLVVALLEMKSFGGTGADSLKTALDSLFGEADEENNQTAGNIPLPDCMTKLVSATADGANVNLGIYRGAITQMKHERPWLVSIHCVNHRLELAIKNAVSGIQKFQECDHFTQHYFISSRILEN